MKHHQDFSNLHRNRLRHVLRLRTTTPSALVLVAVLPFMLGFGSCVPVDKPVAGTRLSVTNYPDAPSRNAVFFVSEERNLTVPMPQSPGDPTVNGASLTLSNTAPVNSRLRPADGQLGGASGTRARLPLR